MRLFKRYNKRVMVPMVLAGAIVLGNAFSAFAHHGPCTDEPAASENSAHVGLQDSWVWVQPNASLGWAVGNDANNLAVLNNGGTDTVCVATPQGGGDYIITNTDSNPSSLGTMFSTSGTGAFSGVGVGPTGAEAGNLTACNPTTGGSCTTGTTVKAAGLTLLQLQNKTGVDDNTTFPVVTQGTTDAQNIACVGSTCVRSVKVSAGNVVVYANSSSGIPVPLCVSVGPGLACP